MTKIQSQGPDARVMRTLFLRMLCKILELEIVSMVTKLETFMISCALSAICHIRNQSQVADVALLTEVVCSCMWGKISNI